MDTEPNLYRHVRIVEIKFVQSGKSKVIPKQSHHRLLEFEQNMVNKCWDAEHIADNDPRAVSFVDSEEEDDDGDDDDDSSSDDEESGSGEIDVDLLNAECAKQRNEKKAPRAKLCRDGSWRVPVKQKNSGFQPMHSVSLRPFK